MAITQISQIKVRRGLNEDLPQLASGEMGWSVDTRQLYIGNGTLEEGAPVEGHTEILTQFSILDFTNTLAANVGNVAANLNTIQNEITALQIQLPTTQKKTFGVGTSGLVTNFTANNAIITYVLDQGLPLRKGTINVVRSGLASTVGYFEDYAETGGTTDVYFYVTGNATYANLWYTTTSSTTFLYQITTIS